MMGHNSLILAATSKSSGYNPTTLILILGAFVVIYLVFLRPQRQRQRQYAEQQNSVQPGAEVRTTAGMYATVVEVDGDDVVLEVAPGVHVRYMKRAIMNVVTPAQDVTDDVGEMTDETGETDETDDGTPEATGSGESEETAHEQVSGARND